MDADAVPPAGLDFLVRPRSKGPLTADEVARCRAVGVTLVFDPVQIGWLPESAPDDLLGPAPVVQGEPDFRPWTEADARAYREMLSDPELWTYLPESLPDPMTIEDARDLIDLANRLPEHEVRAVVVGGVPVGQVRLLHVGGQAEISYWLGHAYRGRGIARRALLAWTRLCRMRHPSVPLFARIHRGNAASRRVAEAAGFVLGHADPQDPRFLIYEMPDQPRLNSGSVPA